MISIGFHCGFLVGAVLWGIFGTYLAYREGINLQFSRMERTCKTTACVLVAVAIGFFALGVRYQAEISDIKELVRHQRRLAEPAEQMFAIQPLYRVTTPSGRQVIWSKKYESALRTRVGGLSVSSGSDGRSYRFGGSEVVNTSGLRGEHSSIGSEF